MRFVLVLTLSVLATCMAGLPSTQSRRTDPDATRIERAHDTAKMLPSRRIGADTVDHRVPLQAVVTAAFAFAAPPCLVSLTPQALGSGAVVPLVLARSSRGPPAARFAI